MSNYFENKLRSKLEIIFKNQGTQLEIGDIDYSNLELGSYEILWSGNYERSSGMIRHHTKVTGLKKLKNNNFEVEGGKYLIDGRVLFSSQFIFFDLKEWREDRLKEILK